MTFKMPHKNPEQLARTAFRMITRRLAQGYWPYAYPWQFPEGWTLIVTVKNEKPPKPSDRMAYKFEYRCVDEATCRKAADRLRDLCLGQTNAAEAKETRSGKPQSTKEILEKHPRVRE